MRWVKVYINIKYNQHTGMYKDKIYNDTVIVHFVYITNKYKLLL